MKRFAIFSRRDWLGRKRWYWHMTAGNHKIVATSGEGYANYDDCSEILGKIRAEAALACVDFELP